MKLAVEHVSDTAHLVAFYRAQESVRENALFIDPFAQLLAGSHGEAVDKQIPLKPEGGWILALRTKSIDEHIARLAHQGTEVVVNFACGLDSRPYRLNLPSSLTWIEVDLPRVIEYKSTLLAPYQPKCAIQRISCDLSIESARQEILQAVAAKSESAVALTEGLLPYLEPATVDRWAAELATIPSFQYWLMDHTQEQAFRYIRGRLTESGSKGTLSLPFSPPKGPEYFGTFGWKCLQFETYAQISAKHGRTIPFPIATPEARDFVECSGIALLTPSVNR